MRSISFALAAAFTLACTLIGCGGQERARPESPPELPRADITHWTDTTELFMEYPTLVAGQTALFAVHLTHLADFQPVTAGRAVLELTPEAGGPSNRLVGPTPSRPGIFRVEATAPAAGRYRWSLVLENAARNDRHDLGTVTVFPKAAAGAAHVPDAGTDATAIAYLKEQQWTNPFATAVVSDGTVRTALRLPATVHPLPGGEAIVAAPAAGRLVAEVLPSIGDRVRAGQTLARLEPRLTTGPDRATLEADVSEARAAVEAAHAEQRRAEHLLAERAVPARRLEDARRAVGVVEARLRAAEARLAQRDEALRTGGGAAAGNAFALRAPIAGRIAEVMATLGAAYEEGAPLFRIVRTDRVELDVQVPAPDVAAARRTVAVAFEAPGAVTPTELMPQHIHDSGVIDSRTGALSLQMEVSNVEAPLLVGQVGTAVLYARDRMTMPTVPKTAVLTEAGRPYVFVQVGGEQFVRRFIEVASRDGDRVAVKSGVATGERVVVTGAYDVQLASAATSLPAEGHVH